MLAPGGARERIARGHPWVWRDAIASGLEGAKPGDEVQVVAADGSPVGRGLADPGSPIAVRMWTRAMHPVDRRLWQARAERACALRTTLFGAHSSTEASTEASTDAYRLVHGEGDRMPGFVVDRYAAAAVVRTDGEAAAARLADFVEAAWPALSASGVSSIVHRDVHRTKGQGQTHTVTLLRGPQPPESLRVVEHGVPFVVDILRGQKTGAFLDQRENRRRVGSVSAGRRVLNLFSYAGGFSAHAVLGGATHVTSVDMSAAAHATAQESFRAAGIDPSRHAFVTAEARSFLDGARARGETWDLVVSDPPSFAPSHKAVARALTAYRALHRACVSVLSPGGILCASSCSSHVDLPTFLETLDDATTGERDLSVLEVHGAGPDHPTLAGFPEGRYLKFVVMG